MSVATDNLRTLEGLFGAYGCEVQACDGVHVRFGNGRTFFDVWDGRRGLTFAAYDPRPRKMRFFRNVSHRDIEDTIIRFITY